MDPNGSYIILVEGEDGVASNKARTSIGSSFIYTYNDTSYKCRWVTVYATDNEWMRCTSSADVFEKSGIVGNVVDTAIGIYASAWGIGGEIVSSLLSIFGWSVTDYYTPTDLSLTMNASTVWTQRYTQVWDAYNQMWYSGCCVEEVYETVKLMGSVWNNAQKKFDDIEGSHETTHYSKCFFDTDWRKKQAVIYYLNGQGTCYDSVGDAVYTYEGTEVIRHCHRF